MSANQFQPHILILPEDDANRDIAIGFRLLVKDRQFQIEDVAGGWRRVMEVFLTDYASEMRKYPRRYTILLLDFDGHPEERLDWAREQIPEELRPRVFVLGALTEPEDLRPGFGPYESIGKALAADCREGTDTVWGDALLRHNSGEVERLRQSVRDILF